MSAMRRWGRFMVMASAVSLMACSFSPDKPRPAELPPVAALMGTRLAWTAQTGPVPQGVVPTVAAGRVWVGGAAGNLLVLDGDSGREVWRLNLDAPLATGIGSDGETGAVVTQGNELVAVAEGKVLWRARLSARAFTTPLVAGRRVFVLTADRTISAFDARTGARLWSQPRTGEPLVLRQAGVLLAFEDTLVAGLSGRLAGLNPQNGALRWEAPIANPRGTNEVERLVDLTAPVSRVGSSLCARAYSAAVGCVDASRGRLLWTLPAQGVTGVHGDDRLVFGAESDGRVLAWQRSGGEVAWTVDRLKYRDLTAPVALGRVVAIGDGTGLVHLLSREDGAEMTRLSTDGSAIVGAPVLAGQTLVVQTRNGGVFAWRPQ